MTYKIIKYSSFFVIFVIFVILIGMLANKIIETVYAEESDYHINIIDIIESIHKADIKEHVGAKVIFEFKEIREHKKFKDYYYIYINEKSKYNVFLLKNIKIDIKDNDKLKKVTGIIYKVENSIIFIKPDKIDILNK